MNVVAEEAHLEVAHSDAREPGRVEYLGGDALSGGEYIVGDFEAVEGVLVAKEPVQHVELGNDVKDEKDFGDKVDEEQVVALALAKYNAAEFAEKAGGSRQRARR